VVQLLKLNAVQNEELRVAAVLNERNSSKVVHLFTFVRSGLFLSSWLVVNQLDLDVLVGIIVALWPFSLLKLKL
jgi:hypothetical protein